MCKERKLRWQNMQEHAQNHFIKTCSAVVSLELQIFCLFVIFKFGFDDCLFCHELPGLFKCLYNTHTNP